MFRIKQIGMVAMLALALVLMTAVLYTQSAQAFATPTTTTLSVSTPRHFLGKITISPLDIHGVPRAFVSFTGTGVQPDLYATANFRNI